MNRNAAHNALKKKIHVKDGGTSSQPREAYAELYKSGPNKGKTFKRHFGKVASKPGFNNYD